MASCLPRIIGRTTRVAKGSPPDPGEGCRSDEKRPSASCMGRGGALPVRRADDVSLGSDCRYLLRSLLRSPGQAVAVWAITVVWFAVAPALLSLLGALEWRSLPFPDSDRIVEVQAGLNLVPDLAATGLFQAVSSYDLGWIVADGPRGAVTVLGAAVDAGFFQTLRSQPVAGRVFSPGDIAADAGAVVVTARLSRCLFGRAVPPEHAVVRVAGRPLAVLGVLRMGIVGRLAAGTSVKAADPAVRRVAHEYEKRQKILQGDVEAVSLDTVLRRRSGGERGILGLSLAGLLAFVLLAYTSALAGSLAVRQGELALRIALGARRLDLVRLLLLEIVLLAVPGFLTGLPIAILVVARLSGFVPPSVAELIPPRLDLESLALACTGWAVAALLSTALAGISTLRFGLASMLAPERGEIRRTGPQTRLRLGFVCAVLSLAVALGACTAVLRQSLANLEGVPLGFEPRNLASAVVRFAVSPAPAFLSRLANRLRSVPGVEAVSFSDAIPFAAPAGSLEISSMDRSEFWLGQTHRIEGDYLKVLGLRVLAGRDLAPFEKETGAQVALLNEEGAREIFGTSSPLGQSMLLTDEPIEIVGIVPTVRETVQLPRRPQLYLPLPFRQTSKTPEALALLVRLSKPLQAEDLSAAMAGTGAAVSQVRPLPELVDASLAPERLARDLVSLQWFATLTLVALATFGTFSWLLELRALEFAVRLALGDSKAGLGRRVLRSALGLTAAAILLGLAIYLPAGQALRVLLYGVEALSPRALLAAIAAVGGVALGAVALAARSALRRLSLDRLKGGGTVA
jgi:putative ABC transport system permease protein